jgi:TRAP-type C4-dicarboxylate transport system substrate-binding protein
VAGGLLLLHAPVAARAQTVWDMATEYPQSAMPGIGMTTFAKHVAALTDGKLAVQPSFDATKGIRSADMLSAIAQGRVQAGDTFAGSLEAEDAIFALPSLPFLVTSIDDAHQLADLARPYMAAALQKRGQRLLYLTPWPPSGIWSKMPLRTAADLAGLSIRTYDRTSREVFARAGAKASSISFAELLPRLTDGSINAVLSSGDGTISRTLWEYLPYFSEITYSLPMSVASVNQAAFDSLTPELREAVDAAGRLTETELWFALSTRLQQNHQRMRERGVTIDSDPAPALIAALQEGAAAAREEWCARSGPACERILGVFKASGVDLTFAPP